MVVEPGGHRVPLQAHRSLLLCALDAGLRLPHSCRNGTCRACLCRLRAGTVRHVIDWPGLSADEKAEGWILPCVAAAERPTGAPPGQPAVVIDQPAARRLDAPDTGH